MDVRDLPSVASTSSVGPEVGIIPLSITSSILILDQVLPINVIAKKIKIESPNVTIGSLVRSSDFEPHSLPKVSFQLR